MVDSLLCGEIDCQMSIFKMLPCILYDEKQFVYAKNYPCQLIAIKLIDLFSNLVFCNIVVNIDYVKMITILSHSL